jgi:DNA-binding transcriptional LysR family regulator
MHNAENGLSGNLEIGYIRTTFKRMLPELIKAFHKEYPAIRIKSTHINQGPMMVAMERRRIDLGFTMSFNVIDRTIFDSKAFFHDAVSLAVPRDHALAAGKEIDWAVVAKEPFITLSREASPHFHRLMMKICAARGFSPDIRRWPQTPESVLMDVEVGFGITMIPASMEKLGFSDVRFIEIEGDDTHFSDIVAWRKDTQNRALLSFLTFLEGFSFE